MIINSLLDQDFYKYSQGQLALHQFPSVNVEYAFKCRNEANWTEEHVNRIKEEVKHFCSLKLTDDELSYLSSIPFFKNSYLSFLRLYQPDYDNFSIKLEDGQLDIRIKGSWFTTIYFEVPVLAIVNQVYFEDKWSAELEANGLKKLDAKIQLANKVRFPFADFGTRRRFSGKWQDRIVKALSETATSFVGTSNVFLAKKYKVKPIGTQAHEFYMIHQAIYPLHDFQKHALKNWVKEYKGNLGIALTDTITLKAFLDDFGLHFAKLYDGVRHDSGSPYEFADAVIAHYEKLSIDPETKTIVFSDGLNFEKCAKLYEAYKDRVKISFGVGTFLTNDFDSVLPLHIVIKLVKVNNSSVCKISDSLGKNMCEDLEYISYIKKVFKVN